MQAIFPSLSRSSNKYSLCHSFIVNRKCVSWVCRFLSQWKFSVVLALVLASLYLERASPLQVRKDFCRWKVLSALSALSTWGESSVTNVVFLLCVLCVRPSISSSPCKHFLIEVVYLHNETDWNSFKRITPFQRHTSVHYKYTWHWRYLCGHKHNQPLQ